MSNSNHLFLAIFVAVNLTVATFSKADQSQALLGVYQEYQIANDWGRPEVGIAVRAFLQLPPNGDYRLTGQLLLLNHLMGGGAESAANEAKDLSITLIQQNPGKWQAAIASLSYAAILGFENDPDAMQAAQSALTQIESADLPSESDQFWTQYLVKSGSLATDFRDGAICLVANGYVGQSQQAQADALVTQIVNSDLKQQMLRLMAAP